ncbi:MAG: carboxypeptidase regulatory-like domain-containing protein, partial [Nitrospinae bacterium]|nr:carboxypeptidase regulatory-like domain-containing protein [Nitrospinota bacterium]
MISKRFHLCWMFAVLLSIAFAGSADAYKEGKVSGGGSIAGAIKFDGPAPKQKTLSVNKDKKFCA